MVSTTRNDVVKAVEDALIKIHNAPEARKKSPLLLLGLLAGHPVLQIKVEDLLQVTVFDLLTMAHKMDETDV